MDGTTKTQYARLVIGEALSEDQARQFVALVKADILPAIQLETGFLAAQIMEEEGGNMVLFETIWQTREDCMRYHCSRAYRQMVAKTQHLLIGDFVVKLFKSSARIERPVSVEVRP